MLNSKKILLVINSFALTVSSCMFMSSKTDDNTPTHPTAQSVYVIPELPNEATFAGEKIDLTDYDIRERFERELTSFSYTHNLTLMLLKRANRYFPVIEPILKEEGLPADFIYLMAIESSIDPRIVSPAKAAGLWQIMPTTGKELGLEVNADIDERFNIEKSTRAAAKYLKRAYAKYGNWLTAASSYNAGQGRITSELSKQDAEHFFDLLLVDETSRYPFRMIALKAIMQNPAHYGFCVKRDQLYKPIKTTTVPVDTTITSLVNFAAKYDITYRDLKIFNPWLRGRTLPNKSRRNYKILIPVKEDLNYRQGEQYPVYNENWVID